MIFTRRVVLAIALSAPLVGGSLSADDPAKQDDKGNHLKGWGEIVDPKGDCKARLEGKKLIIEVPGTLHDLSAEYGDTDAPRILRDVEGDFVAEVKVVGDVVHTGARTSTHYLAYHGAGLLVWIDAKNYVRLERAALIRDGELIHYANFDMRKAAKVDGSQNTLPFGATTLRIERKGDTLSAVAQQEDQKPVVFERKFQYEKMPRTVKIGVVAVNTSETPLVAEFEKFSVRAAEPDKK